LLYVTTQSLYPSYLGIVQNMTQSFNVTKWRGKEGQISIYGLVGL
jgi:hypothetical protein